MDTDVLIIGGGLAGLSLADRLQARGRDWLLAEAQDSFGGRIQSPIIADARFDLGPGWFWPGQHRMDALIRRFGLQVFDQFSKGDRLFQDSGGTVHRNRGYASMEGSLRIAGGMGQVVAALVGALPASRLTTGRAVKALRRTDRHVVATFADGQITARRVVLALPPRIAAEKINFVPALSERTVKAALAIPTWMAGHAKLVAVYDRPYWRDAGLSGFVGWPPEVREKHNAETIAHAVSQLQNMFGPALGQPLATQMMDWSRVATISTHSDRAGTTGHPAFGLPTDLKDLWDGCLHFGSTETAAGFGGYLEGALEASERLSRAV